jgi:hypothetical protein
MLSCCIASRLSQPRHHDGSVRSTPAKASSEYSTIALSRLLGATTTSCEALPSNDENDRNKRSSRPRPSESNPYKTEIEQLQRELDEPCQTCMYTGMAVCAGLSLYFVKLATDETTLPKNRRFLWACSAGSVVAGVYRWYLGWNSYRYNITNLSRATPVALSHRVGHA